MHRYRVIWVGKTAKGYAQEAVTHYLKRIRPMAEMECVDIRGAGHSGRDTQLTLNLEGDSILKRLAPEDHVILLDERGIEMRSAEFSPWLVARSPAVFVLGGAYGLGEVVRARADDVLALSAMTLPHQLARVVLLEQVYRALSLHRGHNYHHD